MSADTWFDSEAGFPQVHELGAGLQFAQVGVEGQVLDVVRAQVALVVGLQRPAVHAAARRAVPAAAPGHDHDDQNITFSR